MDIRLTFDFPDIIHRGATKGPSAIRHSRFRAVGGLLEWHIADRHLSGPILCASWVAHHLFVRGSSDTARMHRLCDIQCRYQNMN